MAPTLDMPKDQWAFYDEPGGGAGTEERFSTMHVFLLGIALDLLDLGLKQGEIIFVLKHCRPTLKKQFDEILSIPNAVAPIHGTGRQTMWHKHYPDSQPLYQEPGKPTSADFTWWMVVRRFDRDVYPSLANVPPTTPSFMEPEYFQGLEALKNYLFMYLCNHRQAVVIELADRARTLPRFLVEAPQIGRGRPSEKGLS